MSSGGRVRWSASPAPPSAWPRRSRPMTSSLCGPCLRDFSRRRPRWGWRRAAKAAARPAGGSTTSGSTACGVQRACVCRIASGRTPLRGIGVAVGAMCPIRPNVVWALDFQFDQTSDGRMLKLLNVIDEYTRECLAIDTERAIDADGVVACLERLARRTGCAGLRALRPRPRVHCLHARRLVPLQRDRYRLHRPRESRGRTPGSSRSTVASETNS